MRPDDVIRLRHMWDATQGAVEFTQGKRRHDLDSDRKLVLALVKAVEILGEATYQTSEETRRRLPDIPWDDIIGMRHRLVHAYFSINLNILWRTIKDDLPPPIKTLKGELDKS